MKILVTGATGFVGKEVVKQLLTAGDEVVVLTRHVARAALVLGERCTYFQWSDTKEVPPEEAFSGVEAVINLMGEGIADKRWDEAQKKRIYQSRVEGTRRLVEAMGKLKKAPQVLVSTSAIGIYGPHGDEEITEKSAEAKDFLANVCHDWEKEANAAEKSGTRVVIFRLGVVIGKNGGALKKMLPIFKMGAGGPLGDGKQWMSWIHLEDLAAAFIRGAKEKDFQGIYNATAPYPVTNAQFTKVLGKVLKRPTFLPAPKFALKAAFGEMSTVLLDGQKAVPKRLNEESHFHYRYPTVEMALKESVF